jgi:hypothetical protein
MTPQTTQGTPQAARTTPPPSSGGVILHPSLQGLLRGSLAPRIGAMAYELAAGLRAGRDILQSYGVTVPEFRQLMKLPEFGEMIKTAKREFASLPNTADRVRLKAQIMTELGLEEMWEIIRHPAVPAAARVSAYNSVKSLTGLDKPEEAQPMQKFSLKIVLPGAPDQPGTITLEGTTHVPDPDLPQPVADPVVPHPDIRVRVAGGVVTTTPAA